MTATKVLFHCRCGWAGPIASHCECDGHVIWPARRCLECGALRAGALRERVDSQGERTVTVYRAVYECAEKGCGMAFVARHAGQKFCDDHEINHGRASA